MFRQDNGKLIWKAGNRTTWIEPYGENSIRVRTSISPEMPERQWSLLTPPASRPKITISENSAEMQNGKITAIIDAAGYIRFVNTRTGQLLTAERYLGHGRRAIAPVAGDLNRVEALFHAFEGERIYGMGQHQHGFLDQKGCVVDLMQRNTEVNVPFMVSSRMYGFLWNNPGVGRAEFGRNWTRWTAEATRLIDYVVIAGDSYAEILNHYVDITGHAPELPEWAAGFWQCKLRYKTQEELLAVAREHKRRGLPMSVIVIDYFHWTKLGEWEFNPKCWPDPEAMVRELSEMGIKVMVSIWPTVNPGSKYFGELEHRGLLVRTERGLNALTRFTDADVTRPVYTHILDVTNPEARAFIWQKVRDNYYKHGIKVWWLDAIEPEMSLYDFDNLRYHAGAGLEVTSIYPMMQQKAFYDGMRSEGEEEIITLGRSAFAGSQRYGAAVWSGDIPSTFESLRAQVRAGLNMGMSGIPWWTMDIGGFYGGDISSDYFRELIVRWFQYGAFCPIFRLHGWRKDNGAQIDWKAGADNEVWSFGDRAYEAIKMYLFMRERLRPYIMKQMKHASDTGTPVMRPLFFDFMDDEETYRHEDEYLFGPDILVAPVLDQGAEGRQVYLPGGADWTDAWTGETIRGGRTVDAEAPLERIPLYLKNGVKLPIL